MDTVNKLYAKITELKNYLNSTDYHRLKATEGSYIIPAEIIEKSQQARNEIDRLKAEIEEIEKSTNLEELEELNSTVSNDVQDGEAL